MATLRIWTPFKIWNEAQWFSDIDPLIKKFKKDRNKSFVNDFWKNKYKRLD